jgi:hypothetical protein
VPGMPHAGAWRTKRRIFTTNYEPKSPVRHASDRSTKKPSLFEVSSLHQIWGQVYPLTQNFPLPANPRGGAGLRRGSLQSTSATPLTSAPNRSPAATSFGTPTGRPVPFSFII